MKKEIEKSEGEKELVYKPIYLPVRFFKKEAYIRIDDYKEVRDKREKVVEGLEEENKKLKELVNEINRDKEHILGEKLILQEENEELKKQNDRLTTQIAKQLLKNV